MEFYFVGAGLALALICTGFYKKGVSDGVKITGHTQEKKKTPAFLQSADEKERQKELQIEREQEKVMQEQFAALVNYQPEYTAVRK